MRGAKQKEMFEISDLRRRETLHLRSICPFVHGGGGGGGTLIISMHFRVFSEGQGTEWRIFFGVLEIPDIFWVDAGPEPTYEEKMRVPTPTWVCPLLQTYPC